MQAAEKPFKDYWASTVHPAIKDDFERLLQTMPKHIAEKHEKQTEKKKEKEKEKKKEKNEEDKAPQQKEAKKKGAKDPVHEKITSVLEWVKEKGKRRNAYLNLAWTGPI